MGNLSDALAGEANADGNETETITSTGSNSSYNSSLLMVIHNATITTRRPRPTIVTDMRFIESSEEKVLLLVCMLLNVALSLLGNGALAFAVCATKSLRKLHNVFYLNLVAADLLSVVVMLLATVSVFGERRWHITEALCDVWLALEFCAAMVVVLSIEALTANIHMQISSPFRYTRLLSRRSLVFVAVCGIWCLSAVTTVVPIAFRWHAVRGDQRVIGGSAITKCRIGFRVPFASLTTAFFALHLIVVLVLNARLYFYARSQQKQIRKFEPVVNGVVMQLRSDSLPRSVQKLINLFGLEIDGRRVENSARSGRVSTLLLNHVANAHFTRTKRLKAIKTLTIMLLNFFVCWCPFFAVTMINSACRDCVKDDVGIWIRMLAFVNASSNPIIYTVCNQQLRSTLLKLVRRRLSGSHSAESRSTHSFDFDSVMPYRTFDGHDGRPGRLKTEWGSIELAPKGRTAATTSTTRGMLRRTSSCGGLL